MTWKAAWHAYRQKSWRGTPSTMLNKAKRFDSSPINRYTLRDWLDRTGVLR